MLGARRSVGIGVGSSGVSSCYMNMELAHRMRRSRNCGFSETLLKLEEFENAGFLFS